MMGTKKKEQREFRKEAEWKKKTIVEASLITMQWKTSFSTDKTSKWRSRLRKKKCSIYRNHEF